MIYPTKSVSEFRRDGTPKICHPRERGDPVGPGFNPGTKMLELTRFSRNNFLAHLSGIVPRMREGYWVPADAGMTGVGARALEFERY